MAKKVILLSGMCGAGKSTIANIFEDLGYACIDGLPVDLADDLVEYLISKNDYRFQKMVITVPIQDFDPFYKLLNNAIPNLEIIIVEADPDTIYNRYKFTRRVHPLLASNETTSLTDAIAREKEDIDKLEHDNIVVIDTTNLTPTDLREKIEKMYLQEVNTFTITFESFGFKYGVAKDADLIFDVRLLDNPYYVASLKQFSGQEEAVYDFVIKKENAKAYLNKLTSLLDLYFEEYEKAGKRHMVVAIGCTGGRHRSVAVAIYLAEYYKECYSCLIKHRDIDL